MFQIAPATYVNFLQPKGVKAFVRDTSKFKGDTYLEVGPVAHNGTTYHTRLANGPHHFIKLADGWMGETLYVGQKVSLSKEQSAAIDPCLGWRAEEAVKHYLDWKIKDRDDNLIDEFTLTDFSVANLLHSIRESVEQEGSDKALLITILFEIIQSMEDGSFSNATRHVDLFRDELADFVKRIA